MSYRKILETHFLPQISDVGRDDDDGCVVTMGGLGGRGETYGENAL